MEVKNPLELKRHGNDQWRLLKVTLFINNLTKRGGGVCLSVMPKCKSLDMKALCTSGGDQCPKFVYLSN